MEAEGARRQRRLDAQHDSAARLRRETPLSEFIDRDECKHVLRRYGVGIRIKAQQRIRGSLPITGAFDMPTLLPVAHHTSCTVGGALAGL
jgi:hypothetical protein